MLEIRNGHLKVPIEEASQSRFFQSILADRASQLQGHDHHTQGLSVFNSLTTQQMRLCFVLQAPDGKIPVVTQYT
jgi:hypothetical protein